MGLSFPAGAADKYRRELSEYFGGDAGAALSAGFSGGRDPALCGCSGESAAVSYISELSEKPYICRYTYK